MGVVTGKLSNLMVIDADSEQGKDEINQHLPDTFITPISKTSKGWHYYFKYQDGLSNSVRALPDCDIRTDGGYIIAPPSKNGKGNYTWLDGLSLEHIPPAPMPENLFNKLHINERIHYRGIGERNPGDCNKPLQTVTSRNISFDKGSRDETLFHLANYLVKSGMPLADIEYYLRFCASHCAPPFPESELKLKIDSAIKRTEKQSRNLTQEIRDLISVTSGNMNVTYVYNSLHLVTRQEKNHARVVLSRLVDEKLIERVNNQAGQFRIVDHDLEEIDFLNADNETVNLWLPFKLHDHVEIMPGNIILIAGEPNAGKTALLLNIIRSNMRDFDIHYFNSEMGNSELRKRLDNFDDIALPDWTFKAYERSHNFADVLKSGKGKLNVIDFLEIHENFYEVGGMLSGIHNKLKGALAIVALQKNRGSDMGLGGFRTLEKPRLALAMSPGSLKIVKAKNWKMAKNPNGLKVDYKIVQGCNFRLRKDWYQA